jgi:signal transduction histidine kinase
VADDRMSYRAPFRQWASIYVVAGFALALALGVMGDLAACGWIRLPALGIPLLTAGHYVAILLAAVAFGPKIGLAAAVLAAIAHLSAATIACGQDIFAQGQVLAFILVGLLAGFLVKSTQTSAGKRLTQTSPAKATRQDRDEGTKAADAGRGGTVPVGFVRSVRGPLSAIESAGYVLEESTLTDENHREVAGIILRECHRLEVLLRSLEIVRTWSPAHEEVALSSMLDEIIRRGDPFTDAAHITLRKEEGSDMMIVCDSELIEQAALNLLANATGFIERGKEVRLSGYRVNNTAIIEISDERLGVLAQLGITLAGLSEGAPHG